MSTALLWWAALEALSLAVVPLTFLVFRSLPDRGYAFTKTLGPLLLTVLLWWGGSLALLPNQRGAVLLLAYVLVMGGLLGIGLLRRREDLMAGLSWPGVLLTEAVFAGTFAFWVLVRAYSPDIDGTEKPMDFAFLNASYRARTFPPEDPWLSGFPISYYYLGYLNAATLTKLVGVPTTLGYNLALATLAAQAAAAASGLAYNLAEGIRKRRPNPLAPFPTREGGAGSLSPLGRGGAGERSALRRTGPLFAGVLAAVLLVGIGNLEGLLELVRAWGWGNEALWGWVDVRDLQATAPSSRWYPTDPWFWWRATRIIHTSVGGQDLDYTITEFPFFSFLLGDLHPHVMALPLVLVSLGIALQLLLDRQPPQGALRQRPASALIPAALLGALGFTNLWDLPTLCAVLLGSGGLRWALATDQPLGERLLGWAAWASAVLAGALALYAPFYFGLAGAGSAVLGPAAQAGKMGLPLGLWAGPGSRPVHLFLLWAPFFLLAGWLLWHLAGRLPRTRRWFVRAALLAPLPLWVLLERVIYLGQADAQSPQVILWPKLWAAGPLLAALALLRWLASARLVGAQDSAALLTAPRETPSPLPRGAEAGRWGEAQRLSHLLHLSQALRLIQALKEGSESGEPASRSLLFGVGMVAAALGLLLFCEVAYLRDVFQNRMNTVFKLTYQAWAFLAVVSAFSLYYWCIAERGFRWVAWAGGGALAALLFGAFVYVPMALFNRSDGFGRVPTLDGLAFVERASPAQRAAVDWLWAATAGRRAVILEASGPQYSGFALMSSRTGLPTALGWAGHESQWRGPLPLFAERQRLIDQIFQARDKTTVLSLLHEHRVSYVIVGPAERSVYPADGLDAFPATLEVAFRQGDMTIYRVPEAAEARRP